MELAYAFRMSTYRLKQLFDPKSIVLAGVGVGAASAGRVIFDNLKKANYSGSISIVDPHIVEVDGLKTFRDLQSLPDVPQLAILTVPAPAIPEIVEAAGKKGIAAAVVITAGLGHGPDSLLQKTADIARSYGMRLLGPNCMGLINPAARLNASFAEAMPPAGNIALVSQSAAVAASLAARGTQRAIGFSAIASIGDMADIDIGDLLDYFALDLETRSILIYIESVKDVRKFISAARAAARIKPVIAIKAGRHRQSAVVATTHTGALAGSDAVYDAALERAGILRVFDLDEFFDAAETLARVQPFAGERLAILTNGGGIGVMAVDRLNDWGGVLANLSQLVKNRLDAILPPLWSKSNPVDILSDADGERYQAALEALLADPDNDAILVLQAPTALASSITAANHVSEVFAKTRNVAKPKPVFCAWIGDVAETKRIFTNAKIPHFSTESDALRGFMHIVQYQRAQEARIKVPPSLPNDFAPDRAAARKVLRHALQKKRKWLDPDEVESLFAAYQIPLLPAIVANTPERAAKIAEGLLQQHESVAVKIYSHDIAHRSEIGGVKLDLRDSMAVRKAATALIDRAKRERPDADIRGVLVQPMLHNPNGRELIAGVTEDPTFGPVILFGRGGTAAEVIDDKALTLPPLDLTLAERLISKTRVARRLKAYRDILPANERSIALTLVKLSLMSADLADITEIDINPLVADESGTVAIDVRIAISPQQREFSTNPRLAIKPYPSEWERKIAFGAGTPALIRPMRPEDERLIRVFLSRITAEDLRLRFFASVRDLSTAFIARLIHLDYNRAIALIALDEKQVEILGVVRLHIDANFEAGEYAVLVRSDLKGRGLGWRLMELVIEYARSVGLTRMQGEVLNGNTSMLKMCEEFGFTISLDPDDRAIKRVELDLSSPNATLVSESSSS